jgi:hypothetical protein
MQITLTLDEEAAARAQALAERSQTSLDALFGEFLRHATQVAAIDEFRRLAREQGACSEPGWRFDREACHDRSAAQ